ncbi:GDP-L-fucose synthase [Accumulibacter sp.]|uniref:GDP-L-fucose synthase family protein n=1 Tax=Accumulibacter sp. TaxID=2053492 RepID=UPI0025F90D03|nr:GDP-L-fucose synthase [Accumulibacter sp.]MCM8595715.1 GDP-L-fucose synthase [Accumulibacter sp.]MCM8624906.1 GDP-L-fucose synthase [Accumulibacter sp.]MDS4049862.1 GDP-L-fucose synthase [Accumulibacter sp.]
MSAPRIYVAGHRGMVGSAIVRALGQRGETPLITRGHAELDLTDQAAVRAFFAAERPDQVYLAAARVGGIHANNSYPAEFIYENLMIEANVMHEAWRAGVRRLLFLGSSCIYPRLAGQPMAEDALLTGPLEPTNEPYAIAKIAGIKLCESYNRQYGTDCRSVMPTNLYGPGDHYDLQNSHVIPAMIRKLHLARLAAARDWPAIEEDEAKHGAIPGELREQLDDTASGRSEPCLTLWGTGTPRREFLHVDDMAEASVQIMNLDRASYDEQTEPMRSHINLGTGQDVTIRELAQIVARVVGYRGRIDFDPGKPDGTPRKLLDVSRLNALGCRARIALDEGLAGAYADFLSR